MLEHELRLRLLLPHEEVLHPAHWNQELNLLLVLRSIVHREIVPETNNYKIRLCGEALQYNAQHAVNEQKILYRKTLSCWRNENWTRLNYIRNEEFIIFCIKGWGMSFQGMHSHCVKKEFEQWCLTCVSHYIWLWLALKRSCWQWIYRLFSSSIPWITNFQVEKYQDNRQCSMETL